MQPALSWRSIATVLGLLGLLGAGCASEVAAPTSPLASIVVTPVVALAIPTTQQFVAVGRDSSGTVMSISPSWSVEAGGGTIDETGLFRAGSAPGAFTSTVKATSGAIWGTASVKVINGAVVSVSISHLERESQ